MNAVAMNAEEREVQQRLYFIEQALKRDPDREYRRELVREYHQLWEADNAKKT